MQHIKSVSLIILAVVWIICTIKPLHYPSYAMHQVGTVIMLGFLFYYHKQHGLSNLAYVGYIVFLMLHVFASHYLYSYVPYNEWLINHLNFDLNKTFGFDRNMFDRLVHFAYGFFLYPFIFELIKNWAKPLAAKHWHVIAIGFVMASSMLYELIEWLIAISMSENMAENYNGQQGDMWDAHKDMAIATFGSVLAVIMKFYKKSPA